jgi:hypothetical protein
MLFEPFQSPEPQKCQLNATLNSIQSCGQHQTISNFTFVIPKRTETSIPGFEFRRRLGDKFQRKQSRWQPPENIVPVMEDSDIISMSLSSLRVLVLCMSQPSVQFEA